MGDRFHGPISEVGARVRHYHPWLEDSAVGTVTRVELREPWDRFFRNGEWHNSYRIYLTDCEHWNQHHQWGPVADTYFDNLSEPWEYENDAEIDMATVLPAPNAEARPGEGA